MLRIEISGFPRVLQLLTNSKQVCLVCTKVDCLPSLLCYPLLLFQVFLGGLCFVLIFFFKQILLIELLLYKWSYILEPVKGKGISTFLYPLQVTL